MMKDDNMTITCTARRTNTLRGSSFPIPTHLKVWKLEALEENGWKLVLNEMGTVTFNEQFKGSDKYLCEIEFHGMFIASQRFTDRTEALQWARLNIDDILKNKIAWLKNLITNMECDKRDLAMSDDFAYTNGKMANLERIERSMKKELATLLKS